MKILSDSDFERKASFIINKEEIKSISEYLSYVKYFQIKWKQKELWYRGVSNHNFKLVPRIYRDDIWEYNEENAYNLFHGFIRTGKQLINFGNNLDEWNWYQIQQHYGLPTRLLDWTEGYLIALFFAVRNIDIKNSPCVWILEPFQLNHISNGAKKLYYTDKTSRDTDDVIVDRYLYDNKELPYLPIAILPPYIDQRIKSQKSCFTIHGIAQDGFDQVFIKCKEENREEFKLVQLILSHSESKTIKKELISAGISESTLFSDLEGLARELKDKYGMK